MDESQLLKGILEACILSLIAKGETYGYEIMQNLTQYHFTHIKDGTLYPILSRLEKKGYIKSRIGESSLGPKRKYFSITEKGEQHLRAFVEQYKNIVRKASKVLL